MEALSGAVKHTPLNAPSADQVSWNSKQPRFCFLNAVEGFTFSWALPIIIHQERERESNCTPSRGSESMESVLIQNTELPWVSIEFIGWLHFQPPACIPTTALGGRSSLGEKLPQCHPQYWSWLGEDLHMMLSNDLTIVLHCLFTLQGKGHSPCHSAHAQEPSITIVYLSPSNARDITVTWTRPGWMDKSKPMY